MVLIGILLSWNRIFPAVAPKTAADGEITLPGLMTNDAPWTAEIPHLRARLTAIDLPALSAEGTALHIHQHLDMNINGSVVSVPAEIGINEAAGFISPIHTHDVSGVVHVESNVVKDFTLGQFFDIWGLRFTTDCIGSYCADTTHKLIAYSNGTLVTGDPRNLILTPHQEIMIVFGEASNTLPIISTYQFEAGL